MEREGKAAVSLQGVINLDFLIEREGSMVWRRRKKKRL